MLFRLKHSTVIYGIESHEFRMFRIKNSIKEKLKEKALKMFGVEEVEDIKEMALKFEKYMKEWVS